MSVWIPLPVEVRDLADEHLPECGWAGGRLHLLAMAAELRRARDGRGEYLAAFPPSGMPVALGGVDYEQTPGAGVLHQLAVLPALRSCGIGTLLITAAENRILERGLSRSELKVEVGNPRAQALYERLGYVTYDAVETGWEQEDAEGNAYWYGTVCRVMRKELSR